ncbi:hypothetical protein L6E12_12410 [Actinokineospora sp. PR83]|uniref:hypothetical protein n=1 Tax=Actinokineospora sp. PR83 TaxID=2884908 RepID=UPI001F23700D|nr:hypothetical protein [Actinokineospora sp. PR83]MCG8916593.1 hypothetical protein [Actinokineospora sp. PR83]
MTRVVIQPSYGKAETRRHWADTLDRAVPFPEARRAGALDAEHLAGLTAAHPGGTARFWGATARHDRTMEHIGAGDVFLLTGQKHVRGIGVVGHGFRDHAFARWLWTPRPQDCLWSNVYSFTDFRPTWIPYEEIWALPGFNPGDNFMGLRLLSEEKGNTILTGLDVLAELRIPTPVQT